MDPRRAFSILGRIGGDATLSLPAACNASMRLSVSSVGSEAMQLGGTKTWPPRSRLSVSSVGSEAMQLDGRSHIAGPENIFQYPRSDRRRCNGPGPLPSPATDRELSVSSVGSEAMQLQPASLHTHAARDFQYPRSDRRRCNSPSRRW